MSLALTMALIGAGVGAVSTGVEKYRNQEELKRQKKMAKDQYDLNEQYGDNLYSLRKDEAFGQLGLQKRNLHGQMGLSTDDYNTSLLAQAYGMQDARIQTGAAIGASLAAEGSSGTRGNYGNELTRAYASQGLERNIELQNRQNGESLNRMITDANSAVSAIGREKASWEEGGYRQHEKALQDSYNYSVFELGRNEFDYQIKKNDPWDFSWDNILDSSLDYITGMFSGAYSGLEMGKGISKLSDYKEKQNR